jgi:hypothetical protein
MADELDEIRKLSPEERIKKIGELEKKRSKEKQGMEELLKESISTIKNEETIKNIKVPEQKKVNVSELFSGGEESQESLEKKAEDERSREKASGVVYKIDIKEAENMYNEIRNMGDTNSWQEEEFREFYRVQSVVDAVDTRLLKDDVAERINSTRSLIHTIRNYMRD